MLILSEKTCSFQKVPQLISKLEGLRSYGYLKLVPARRVVGTERVNKNRSNEENDLTSSKLKKKLPDNPTMQKSLNPRFLDVLYIS